MDYKIGNSNKIDAVGETVEITCPKCNEKTHFSVFSNLDTRFIAKFPLIHSENVYFLVCPKCSAVFGVDNQNGKLFKKGEKLAIGDFDLKELREFNC